MPDIVADSPHPTCSHLLSESGMQESQPLDVDPSSPRAREARERLRQGKLRQPAGPTTRHPQSPAARARPHCPAAEHAGAVKIARPQASSVAAPRRATIAAAPQTHRSGRSSRGRPLVAAHGRGSPGAIAQGSGGHRARRDHAGRGRAPCTAGAYPAARDPAARAISAPASASNEARPEGRSQSWPEACQQLDRQQCLGRIRLRGE